MLLLICCYITSSPFVILIWLCVFLVSSWSFTLSSFSCFTVFPDVKCPSILYEDWTKCKLVVSYYRWVVTVQLLCYACFPVGCLRILTCCIVKNISCVSVPACGPTNFWVTSNFAPPPPPSSKRVFDITLNLNKSHNLLWSLIWWLIWCLETKNVRWCQITVWCHGGHHRIYTSTGGRCEFVACYDPAAVHTLHTCFACEKIINSLRSKLVLAC